MSIMSLYNRMKIYYLVYSFASPCQFDNDKVNNWGAFIIVVINEQVKDK